MLCVSIDKKRLGHRVLAQCFGTRWRSCAPPAFLLLPRSRKFNGQFSRPDMDAPQECLETCKHTEHKTKSTSCGIAHCVCILNFANVWTCLDSENPAQCLLPVCPRWRSASWARKRAKGWWIHDKRLLTMKDSSKSLHTKTTLSLTNFSKSPGQTTTWHPFGKWIVNRNRRPLSTTLPWLTGFRCHASAVIRCAWRHQRHYKTFTRNDWWHFTAICNCILNGLFLTVSCA